MPACLLDISELSHVREREKNIQEDLDRELGHDCHIDWHSRTANKLAESGLLPFGARAGNEESALAAASHGILGQW